MTATQFVAIPSRLYIAQIYSMAAISDENWHFYLSQKIGQHMKNPKLLMF